MHVVQVERRSRYGRGAYLPINPAAKAIAEIAGTTEIRPKDIEAAGRLGFRVIRVERTADGTAVEVETLALPAVLP